MRVAHVLRDDHDTHIGGDLVQLRDSVTALRRLGVDAVAVTRDELDRDVDVVHLYNLQLPHQLRAAARRVRRLAADIPIVLSPIFCPFDRAAVRAESGRRAQRLLHAVGPRRRAEWLFNRAALRGASAILPNSEIEADRLSAHFRIRRDERWHVVRNGLWVERWAGDREPAGHDEPLRVACVGRVEPRKNQRRVVAAIAAIPHARLTLIGPAGEDGYAEAVREEIRGLSGRARWIPTMDQEELKEVLSTTDVHVLASYQEVAAFASMEAAAAGCALVVTRESCSTEEYFGSLATYADPRSASSIAEAILRAAAAPNQPELAHRMRDYDWSAIAPTLLRAYERVLARTR